MLDQAHTAISRPTSFVIVPDNITVRWVGVGAEVSLDEITRLVGSESEEDMDAVDVAGVEADGMPCFGGAVTELEEIIGKLRRAGHLARSLEPEDEEIEDETVVLEDKRREL